MSQPSRSSSCASRDSSGWDQESSCSNSDRAWGIAKFNANFNQLIFNEPQCIVPKVKRVGNIRVKKSHISTERLVNQVISLLKAPPAPRHGYCLYIRFDVATKFKMFSGFYLTEDNLDLLGENFVIELTPSPNYYIEKYLEQCCNPEGNAELYNNLSLALNDPYFFEKWKSLLSFERVVNFFLTCKDHISDNYFRCLISYVRDRSHSEWSQLSVSTIDLVLKHIKSNMFNKFTIEFCVVFLQLVVDHVPDLHDHIAQGIEFTAVFAVLKLCQPSVYYSAIRVLFFLYQMAEEDNIGRINEFMSSEQALSAFRVIVKSLSNEHDLEHLKLTDELSKLCAGRMAWLTQKSKVRPSMAQIQMIATMIQNAEDWAVASDYRKSGSCLVEFSLARDWTTFQAALSTTPPGLLATEFVEHCLSGEDEKLFEISTRGPLCPEDFAVMMVQLIALSFKTMKRQCGGMRLCPFFLTEKNPVPAFLRTLAILFTDTWTQLEATQDCLPDVLQIVKLKLDQSLGHIAQSVDEWSTMLASKYGKEFSVKELRDRKDEKKLLEDHWKTTITEEQTPRVTRAIREAYFQELKEGLVLRKLPKDIEKLLEKEKDGYRENKQEDNSTQFRKWQLNQNEDLLFVSCCTENGTIVKGTQKSIFVSEVEHIIHGPDYLNNILYAKSDASSSKIFSTLKKKRSHSHHLPRGMLIETAEERLDLVCDEPKLLDKLVTAFKMLCFDKYPDDLVESVVGVELAVRMENLKMLDSSSSAKALMARKQVPPLPTSFYDWIPQQDHAAIDPRQLLNLRGHCAPIPSFKHNTFVFDVPPKSRESSTDSSWSS